MLGSVCEGPVWVPWSGDVSGRSNSRRVLARTMAPWCILGDSEPCPAVAVDSTDLAILMAGASTAIALLSLGWTMYVATRLSRSRIVVTVEDARITDDPRTDRGTRVLVVTATNTGRLPTTVGGLFLISSHLPLWVRRLRKAVRWGVTNGLHYSPTQRPEYPVVLGPGEETQVLYDHATISRELEGAGRVYLSGTARTAENVRGAKSIRLAD